MKKYEKYHQPELDLIHLDDSLSKAVGRLAINTVAALSHKISHRNQPETTTFEERMVIDLIEDQSIYGSIIKSDGSEHQLVFPIDDLPAFTMVRE
jgi:hypothetical protein